MYCMEVADGGCGCGCGGECGATGPASSLAGYADAYGGSFGYSSGGDSRFTFGSVAPYSPGGFDSQYSAWQTGGALPLDYASNSQWYDPILDVAGDVGGELLSEVKDWLQRAIGREAWERMPEASKQEAVRTALADLGPSDILPHVGTGAIIAGTLVVLALAAGVRRR